MPLSRWRCRCPIYFILPALAKASDIKFAFRPDDNNAHECSGLESGDAQGLRAILVAVGRFCLVFIWFVYMSSHSPSGSPIGPKDPSTTSLAASDTITVRDGSLSPVMQVARLINGIMMNGEKKNA